MITQVWLCEHRGTLRVFQSVWEILKHEIASTRYSIKLLPPSNLDYLKKIFFCNK